MRRISVDHLNQLQARLDSVCKFGKAARRRPCSGRILDSIKKKDELTLGALSGRSSEMLNAVLQDDRAEIRCAALSRAAASRAMTDRNIDVRDLAIKFLVDTDQLLQELL